MTVYTMDGAEQHRVSRQAVVRLILFMLVAASPALLYSQEPERQELLGELRRVHQIDDPVDRLTAFDTLAKELFGEPAEGDGSEQPAPTRTDSGGEAETGSWLAIVDSDPITDEKVFVALLDAETGQNEFGTKPTLILRRTGDRDDLYVAWSDYFADDYVRVTHRIDGGQPETRQWAVSTNDDATFFPGDASALIRNLSQAERLVVRTTPYNASPITAEFRLEGLEEVLRQHEDVVGDLVNMRHGATGPES